MVSLPREPIPLKPDDIDIHCLNRGYNPRGLSGDPRRCPECFCMNLMSDSIVPVELISARLCQMESSPATWFHSGRA